MSCCCVQLLARGRRSKSCCCVLDCCCVLWCCCCSVWHMKKEGKEVGRTISVNKAQPRMSTDDGGYGYRGAAEVVPAASDECFKCGCSGHWARECPYADGGRPGRYSPPSRYGSGAGGRGDRFGGSDRFASRYADDRYGGGRDRYPPAADRFSGDRYGRWRYGMQSGGRVNITSVANKDSQTFRVKMSVDDWERWCKFKEFLETGKATTYAISANFHGHTSLTTGCETDDKSWLIDSGASRHMVGSYHNFVDYVPDVRRQSVKLADGSSQTVMGSGSVICGPNMSLSSVLHVPSFPINLLSISCITKELNCAVIFFPSWCLFQELGTGRWLGTGNMRDGLYYLDDNVSAMVAAAISQSPLQEFMLLHRRLGHMSFRTLGDDEPEITRLKKALAKSFEVKDLGFLHYFLGIEVAYGAQDIAFVDRADIKAYVGPPTLHARYEILRSCIQELFRVGILISPQGGDFPLILSYSTLKEKLHCPEAAEPHTLHLSELLHQGAEQCEGLSGRSLRKLPFLAHASVPNPSCCDATSFMHTLIQTARRELLESRG